MSDIKKSKLNHYDYIIVGSGLTGLAIAAKLSTENSKVLLLDGADTYGGFNHNIHSAKLGDFDNGLRWLPDTDSCQKALQFLSQTMGTEIPFKTQESSAVTFENGHLRPFLGFGENPPAFYEQLRYFLSENFLQTEIPVHQWPSKLFEKFQGEYMPRSWVTKFVGEDHRINQVIVNGQKYFSADNFIYAGPVRGLKTLLPDDALSAKSKQKLAKNDYWTALCLDLMHDHHVTSSSSLHVLNGTTQDEIGPCVGQFQSRVIGDWQYSQWVTFLLDDDAEDSEVLGAALKKMKRQIKRAYPNAFENLKYERILVVPSIDGNGDLKVQKNMNLANYNNLFIASSQMSSEKNLVGSLLQAEKITSILLGNPTTEVEATTSEEIDDPMEL